MNPEATGIIAEMKRKKAYPDVARHLSRPRRAKEGVNVGKINRTSASGETVIIPHACLGEGVLDKKVTVYAMKFSASARRKIEEKGGKCLPLSQLMKDGAKGRILI